MRRISAIRKAIGVTLLLIASLFLIQRPRSEVKIPYNIVQEFNRLAGPGSQRQALVGSPFADFNVHNSQTSYGTEISWQKFESWSLREKCRWFFETTYAKNPKWSNDQVRERYDDEATDNARFSHIVERLRMYDTCFVQGNLKMDQVLVPRRNLKDFHSRMFPFFPPFQDLNELWPTITHLNSKSKLPNGVNPASSNTTFIMDNSKTFWENWNDFSTGKGLVLTLGERHKDIFLRLLAVLDHLGNSYPIQIVQQENEVSQDLLDSISDFLQSSNQEVYHVSCGPVLNVNYIGRLNYFVNKWLATIFNTYSEVVLLDADVVPFISLNTFFDDPRFLETGALFYKDRNLLNEYTFDHCIDMFKYLEPSAQAVLLMNHRMKVNSSIITPTTNAFFNDEQKVYQRFFYRKLLHNVDSGLVVLNKRQKLTSLILSFFMNLDSKISSCVYGDKELFWLAQLFSGNDYTIDSPDGAVIGSLRTVAAEEPKGQVELEICATQMGHVNQNKQLLWTNGGLKTCKVPDAARRDFSEKPEYFESRYESLEALRDLYEKPLVIDGYIIPEVAARPWFKSNECCEYSYCASIEVDSHKPISDFANFAIFGETTSQQLSSISEIWNGNVDI
ncbi:LANO_0H19878g1_1 [Lachancea nothofagi CBS 11611]|uniref:LANO_0H19878g1_1 n=1 Tax=Lachancea nothofagi CBS 11611 TaxID=1266666 RepID=A0A1G4KNE8_9SACH|nr:LANO_0H19878g1_1 [Lachancea nothofagi CBS 11611]